MRAIAFVICLDCGEVMTGFANAAVETAFYFPRRDARASLHAAVQREGLRKNRLE